MENEKRHSLRAETGPSVDDGKNTKNNANEVGRQGPHTKRERAVERAACKRRSSCMALRRQRKKERLGLEQQNGYARWTWSDLRAEREIHIFEIWLRLQRLLRACVNHVVSWKSGLIEQNGFMGIDMESLSKHEEMILDICLFGVQLATTRSGVQLATTLGLIVNKYARSNGGSVFGVVSWLVNQYKGEVYEQAAPEIDVACNNVQEWWTVIRTSPVWKDVYRMIAYVTCIVVHGFDTTKLASAKKYIEDTKIMNLCNSVKIFDTIGKIVENVCTRILQAWRCGSFLAFFHSQDSYAQWYGEAVKLDIEHQDHLEDMGYDRFGLLQRVCANVVMGEEMLDVQKKRLQTAAERRDAEIAISLIHRQLSKMVTIRQNLMNRMNAVKMRATPFASMICGGSSVGKSGFCEIMRKHFSVIRKLSNTPAYVRNSALPHWDNWESYYWAVILDDVACFKPEHMPNVDPSLAEVISVINPIAMQPPRADLADKGRAAVQAQLVMITSNVQDLNVDQYFSHKAAMLRRCGYQIIVEVKPEFTLKANEADARLARGLDAAKAVHGPNEFPDWWMITVKKAVIAPKNSAHISESDTAGRATDETCNFMTVKHNDRMLHRVDMRAFLVWYTHAIKEHFAHQEKMLASQELVNEMVYCEHDLPRGMCQEPHSIHLVEQSGEASVAGKDDATFGEKFWNYSLVVKLSSLWEFCNPVAFFLGLAYFMIRSDAPSGDYPTRRIFCNLGLSFWNTCRGVFAYFLPFYLYSCLWILPCMCLHWVIAHPFVVWYSCTGNDGMYKAVCTSMGVARDVADVWISNKLGHVEDCLRAIGRATSRFLGFNTVIAAILIAIPVVLKVLYGWMFSGDLVEQGQAMSLGSPMPARKEPQSVYARPRTELDILDIPRHALSLKGKNLNDVEKFYGPNLAHIVCKDSATSGTMGNAGNCLFLGGHLALVQSHVMKFDETCLVKLVLDESKNVSKNFRVTLDKSHVNPMGEHLFLVNIQNTSLKRDLRLSFPPKEIRSFQGDGFLLKREADGNLRTTRVTGMKYQQKLFGLSQSGWRYVPARPTQLGDCGSILFAETPSGPVLVGMHQWMNQNEGASGATDLTTLEEFVVSTVTPGDVSDEKGRAGKLVPLHPKSIAVTTQEKIQGEVYGCFDGHRQKAQSRVQRTCLADGLEEQGYVIEYGAPDMSFGASNRQFESMAGERCYRYSWLLKIAAGAYVEHILKDQKPQWREECHIIDQQTSINGQDGVRYVDAINLSTSAGFPWSEGKRKHMHAQDNDWDKERFVNPEIQVEIDRIWANYMDGRSSNPVFKASLKDEGRKLKKIAEKNTRVFYGGPLGFIIVQRQLFLWFVRLSQMNRFTFCMAPGMDAASTEWDELYHYLKDFSEDCVAGDYKNFDCSMDEEELHTAYDDVICAIATALGASDDHVAMMKCCAEDLIHVLVDYFGTLVRLGLNPSGQALTVTINCIVNVLRLMVAFMVHEGTPRDDEEAWQRARKFFDRVHCMTYGDDNILTVKDTPMYNHTRIAEIFSTMGITYTMADKDAESVPYITLEEASFLKRSFRFDIEVNSVVAPLCEESMVKALAITIPSKVVPQRIQLEQTITGMHREAFLHGREFFEKWFELTRTITCGTIVEYVAYGLPTYDELLLWYLEKGGLIEQAGQVCLKCGHDCCFRNYRDKEDLRLCAFCGRCRFVDADLDCMFCGIDDTCEECGSEMSVECTGRLMFVYGTATRVYMTKCLNCEETRCVLCPRDLWPNGVGHDGSPPSNQNPSN